MRDFRITDPLLRAAVICFVLGLLLMLLALTVVPALEAAPLERGTVYVYTGQVHGAACVLPTPFGCLKSCGWVTIRSGQWFDVRYCQRGTLANGATVTVSVTR